MILDASEFEPRLASNPGTDPSPRVSGRRTLAQVVMENGLTLSSLLRGLGGLVVVAAFVVLLFQGWRDGDDLGRYFLLIGHTLVLTLAGFAAGHLLRESKGARLFIGLALAAVPVNFAFLGGISYPHLTWDPLQTSLESWRPLGNVQSLAPGLALSLTGITVPLLAISIWIGYLVMARRSAWALSGLYLLTNAALLVPSRNSGMISALLLGLGLLLAILVVRLRRRDPSLATPEGVFARAVLVLPLLVMGGRSIWFYAPSGLFFTTLALVGYLALRQALHYVIDTPKWKATVEWGAVVMASISALFAFATLVEIDGLRDGIKLPIAGALLSVLLYDLSTRSTPRVLAYRNASALTVLTALTANQFVVGGLPNALLCLLAGITVLGYGFVAKQRATFFAGLVTALFGMAFAGIDVFAGFTIGGWTGLVLLGVATILAGSLVERHGQRLGAVLIRWHRHFDTAD
jgi:hypothetical protein